MMKLVMIGARTSFVQASKAIIGDQRRIKEEFLYDMDFEDIVNSFLLKYVSMSNFIQIVFFFCFSAFWGLWLV